MTKELLVKAIKRAKEHLPPFEALYAVTDDYRDYYAGKKVELMPFGSKSQPQGNHFGDLLGYAAYLVQHVHQKKFSHERRREISMWFSHLCRMQLELYLLGLSIEKLEHVDIQARKSVGDTCHDWVIELSAWFCEKVFDEDWNDPRKQIVFEELSGKQRKMWYYLRLMMGGEKPFVRSRRGIPDDVAVELRRQRTEQTSGGPDHTGVEKDRTQKVRPTKGACESDGAGHDGPGFIKDSPTTDEISNIPPEERRNSELYLLMLLAQAYYKMLECTVSMASWCTTLDLELNGYYLWAVQCITNLLKNSDNLKDFPVPFEPLLPDLYPATTGDYDWEDMLGPRAEQFLSTVQQYVQSKGIYEPEKGSVGWVFIELFRPSVNAAIQKAIAYNKRVREYMRNALDSVSPKDGGSAPTTGGERSASDGGKGENIAQPEQGGKPSTGAAAIQQKDIWEDISPDMKDAIQAFWQESEVKRTEGKRL